MFPKCNIRPRAGFHILFDSGANPADNAELLTLARVVQCIQYKVITKSRVDVAGHLRNPPGYATAVGCEQTASTSLQIRIHSRQRPCPVDDPVAPEDDVAVGDVLPKTAELLRQFSPLAQRRPARQATDVIADQVGELRSAGEGIPAARHKDDQLLVSGIRAQISERSYAVPLSDCR